MSLNRLFKIIFLIISCLPLSVMAGQPAYYDSSVVEVRRPVDHRLEEYRQDDSFDYSQEDAERQESWFSRLLKKIGDFLAGIFLSPFGQSLKYVIIVILAIVLITIFVLKYNVKDWFSKKGKANNIAYVLDEDIREMDIEALLQKALENKQFRLAIRLYYLKLLKQLTEQDIIDWQLHKTNRDYLYEMRTHSQYQPFRRLTQLYEYVWYGNFSLDTSTFKGIEGDFMQLIALTKYNAQGKSENAMF